MDYRLTTHTATGTLDDTQSEDTTAREVCGSLAQIVAAAEAARVDQAVKWARIDFRVTPEAEWTLLEHVKD